ncbi:MAG: YafY family protein [Pseudomonadota bacterium]
MRRADRLFQIVQHLRGGRLVTAAKLAERLEVSERTIYRDVLDLQTNGVPIDGERGVGYIMRSGFDMPPLMFTKAELVALTAGARFVKAWGGTDMAAAAQEALVKIEAVVPPDQMDRLGRVEIRAPGYHLPDEHRALLDRAEAAIEAREKLSLAYEDAKGATTTRTVRPLALWYWGKTWTLVSWCELREDFRLFRVDRIADLTETGERFPNEKGKSLTDLYADMERSGYPVDTLRI